ncbi:MAG TPA: DpnII family type II restriction endonuclease [Candidatus Paceibacterota bacterium]
MRKPISLGLEDFHSTISPVIPMPELALEFDAFIDEIITAFKKIKFDNDLIKDFKKIAQLEIISKPQYRVMMNKGAKKENVGWQIILAITGVSNEKMSNYIIPHFYKARGRRSMESINQDRRKLNFFAHLFVSGHGYPKLKEILGDEPVVLRRFSLAKHFVNYQGGDERLLRVLLEDKYSGRLMQKVGTFVEDGIVGGLVEGLGETYQKGSIDFLKKHFRRTTKSTSRNPKIDLIIPNKKDPKILIECSYTKTTASGQTKKIDANDALFSAIRSYNSKMGKNLIFVNFIDGAGWKMRGKSDLKRFINSCDFAVNYQNLGLLEEIIAYYS